MTRIAPRPEPDFTQVNLAAGGRIHAALADEHRVLRCMASYHAIFVIANSHDGDRAQQAADELNNRHKGVRSIYTILLSDAHLTAMADGAHINVAVLMADTNHTPARTAIRAHNSRYIDIDTEHGRVLSEVTLAEDLRAGDVYTCGTERLGSADTRLAVYRARADYDPATGEVQHHLVDPGYTPGPEERTGALTDGPDVIVFRVVDKDSFLTRLDLTDLATSTR